MSATNVTIHGVFYPSGKSASDKPIKGTLVGLAWNPLLSVGGGPAPGGQPPSVDNTLPGALPHPEHPIALPPDGESPPDVPPDNQPDSGGWLKPPTDAGGWCFHEDYGWLYKPKGAGPKR